MVNEPVLALKLVIMQVPGEIKTTNPPESNPVKTLPRADLRLVRCRGGGRQR